MILSAIIIIIIFIIILLSNSMCNSYNYFRGVFSCRNMAAVPVLPVFVKKGREIEDTKF